MAPPQAQKITIIMVWSAFFWLSSSFIVSYSITGLMGIDLARLVDLPLDVPIESRRVTECLPILQTSHEESSESKKIQVAIRRKLCCGQFLLVLRLGLPDLFWAIA
jgi:hypothetical protein